MEYRQIDHLISVMASYIKDNEVVSTGVASLIPLLAILYARHTTVPDLTYINCIGAINPAFDQVGFDSADVRALERPAGFIPLPDLFDLGVKNRIDTMFFSGAQIDRQADLNLTCIGNFCRPKVKMAGPAGSSVMLHNVKRPVVFVLKHTIRIFVPQVDFVSARGLAGRASIDVVSNLGILRISSNSARVVYVHPWADMQQIRDNTGFEVSADIDTGFAIATPDLDILEKFDAQGHRYKIMAT